ncbi:hypothetical protein FRACYDRAFT_213551 [Fragilariopsis cylindrus CCMP1102]|uniref:HAD-superfamily hydrolase n=1 Tax=Fragilariopsis cylindrus CCMP1102 TaxID=635003 RepID=A0A1E7ELY3_9STRA|nr:hypothetical protein FRACYDRAFT_213551 [Fragilariopsis cylindrus CCMP1102]|eukprot:OEU06930.1 hypothetical protein FRACYDRAFT_213551 [Fragilariopsis cylindrus CCMP1102]
MTNKATTSIRRRRLPSLLWAAVALTATCTYNTQAVTAFTTHESFTVPSSSSSSSSSYTSLIDSYDAFILDQFGVMHNGKHPLEGAKELIDLMIAQKKKLIILSNTSSPSKTTLQRLGNLGFNSNDHFLDAITSGEEAINYINTIYGCNGSGKSIESKNGSNDIKKKKKFIWFTWDPLNENVPNPMYFISQLDENLEPTTNIDEADFIVAHGVGVIRDCSNNNDSDNNNNSVSIGNFLNDDTDWLKIDELLYECSKRNLPLICANPDMVVKYHDNTIKNMPGQIAQRYITKFHMNNDQKTIIFGKPNKEHFQACVDVIYQNQQQEQQSNSHENEQHQQSLPRLRIAHVGDSMSHDIAGANSVDGIDSIFIIGGIHSDELLTLSNGQQQQQQQQLPSDKQLKEFFEQKGHTPTHVVPMFQI